MTEKKTEVKKDMKKDTKINYKKFAPFVLMILLFLISISSAMSLSREIEMLDNARIYFKQFSISTLLGVIAFLVLCYVNITNKPKRHKK